MRYAVLFGTLLFVICVAGAKGRPVADDTLPSNYVPSGNVMYKEYCAVCHGVSGKGLSAVFPPVECLSHPRNPEANIVSPVEASFPNPLCSPSIGRPWCADQAWQSPG